ncbi:hypothetical protein P4U90_22750 [Cytobacillus kochii]|uniref:hypothetical protein n=1 Tax=Cytobacillus kochii TaxID=859143 RepID=UPI002E245108|nr:hypothetical protein [Cytobacillus kochii]
MSRAKGGIATNSWRNKEMSRAKGEIATNSWRNKEMSRAKRAYKCEKELTLSHIDAS